MNLKLIYIILVYFFFSSCQKEKKNKEIETVKADTTINTHTSLPTDTIPEESYIDSLTIGEKRKNKIELLQYRTDSVYVIINFYSRKGNEWLLRNKFTFLKDGITGLEAGISDFTNDGYNDVILKSSIAARGANEMRTLLIYNKLDDRLIHIKNSEQYANLQYNNKLKCIDAFNVYGGSTSYFLNIEGDSLKPFASVQLFNGLTISEYDKHGNEKVIRHDTSIKHSYARYKSYAPLIEYEEY